MDFIRISGIEHSSMVLSLSQTKYSKIEIMPHKRQNKLQPKGMGL